MMPALEYKSPISLFQLLEGIVPADKSLSKVLCTGLCLDSRKAKPGEVFFALSGQSVDGLHFAREALQSGVIALLHQAPANDLVVALAREYRVPIICDPQLADHIGDIASRFYQQPSSRMKVIAVTGTDGKTSVSHFLAQALDKKALRANSRAAVIGTVGSGFLDEIKSSTHTTPDAISLQSRMAELHDNGASHIAMEASSHGLEQGRLNGTKLELAVLTNLGRDHLDYHGDLQAYQSAKQRLFEMPKLGGAVLNWHDPFGQHLLNTFGSRYPISIYGIGQENEIRNSQAADWVCAKQLECAADGLSMHIVFPDGETNLTCNLLGKFNALNVLAVAASLRFLSYTADEIIAVLSRLKSVPGRMQVISQVGMPKVVIDYAHTPQALSSALNALRLHCHGKLWCVFGCGGDRDIGKRSEMGGIADDLADRTIITNDNPRSESPEKIAEDIKQGMRNGSDVLVILDRADAITTALKLASSEDFVLVAGKGHETSQEIGDKLIPFSDQLVVEQYLETVR